MVKHHQNIKIVMWITYTHNTVQGITKTFSKMIHLLFSEVSCILKTKYCYIKKSTVKDSGHETVTSDQPNMFCSCHEMNAIFKLCGHLFVSNDKDEYQAQLPFTFSSLLDQ